MGQCVGCCREKEQHVTRQVIKQDKNIDDKRMLKVGVEVMKKDFCIQIGYNRRAVKAYGAEPRVSDPTNSDEVATAYAGVS